MTERYTVGIDFGTEAARAVLVDVTSGWEVATAISAYRHGVIDDRLPLEDEVVQLEADGPSRIPVTTSGRSR